MVLREVLQLYEPPRPPTAAVCAVELKHSVSTTVRAGSVFHRLIFLYRGFRKLLTEFQHLRKLLRSGFQYRRDFLFSKAVHLQAVLREPLFHLLNGIRVIE